MKLTKDTLKQLIQETIQENNLDQYWTDEQSRPWDPDIDTINESLKEISIEAIDYYNLIIF